MLAPGANLTPVSKGAEGFRALVPKGTNKIPSHEAGTEALCRAKCLRSKAQSKSPQRATTKASITSREAADGVANTRPVPNGTNPALSHGARIEALFSASYLRRKVQNKAPQRAKHEVAVTSPPKSSEAKLVPHRRATRLTSPSGVNIADDKVIFKSPKARNFKARGFQPEPSRPLSKQDHVSLANTDLREFLTNKGKLELLYTSPSCCEQVACQLITVHSVHCRLGPMPATLLVRPSVFD